jgi:hypothetical protein
MATEAREPAIVAAGLARALFVVAYAGVASIALLRILLEYQFPPGFGIALPLAPVFYLVYIAYKRTPEHGITVALFMISLFCFCLVSMAIFNKRFLTLLPLTKDMLTLIGAFSIALALIIHMAFQFIASRSRHTRSESPAEGSSGGL